MTRSLRGTACVLLVAAALLASTTPAALATPREGQGRTASIASKGVVSELLAWLGQWVGGAGLQSLWAGTGGAIDPDGEPAAPSRPGSGDGVTVLPQGGHTMDPDG